jgi:hypothetical protein
MHKHSTSINIDGELFHTNDGALSDKHWGGGGKFVENNTI